MKFLSKFLLLLVTVTNLIYPQNNAQADGTWPCISAFNLVTVRYSIKLMDRSVSRAYGNKILKKYHRLSGEEMEFYWHLLWQNRFKERANGFQNKNGFVQLNGAIVLESGELARVETIRDDLVVTVKTISNTGFLRSRELSIKETWLASPIDIFEFEKAHEQALASHRDKVRNSEQRAVTRLQSNTPTRSFQTSTTKPQIPLPNPAKKKNRRDTKIKEPSPAEANDAVEPVGLVRGIKQFDPEGIKFTHKYRENTALRKIAEKSRKAHAKAIHGMIERLKSGNLNAGLGSKHMKGTQDVILLRAGGHGGPRVFVRKEDNEIQIVAIGDHNSMIRVTNILRKLYPHQ